MGSESPPCAPRGRLFRLLGRLLLWGVLAALSTVLYYHQRAWASEPPPARKRTFPRFRLSPKRIPRPRPRTWRRADVRAFLGRLRALYVSALALTAAALMVASAYAFRPGSDALARGWWLFVGGALTLGGALWVARQPLFTQPVVAQPTMRAIHWPLFVAGALALWALAEINGHLFGLPLPQTLPVWQQGVLWGGGLALMVAAGLPLRRWGRLRISGEMLWLVALTALALAVRFFQLGERVRVLVDEAHYVVSVNLCRIHPDVPLLAPMPTTASFPFLYACGEELTATLFGHNLLGLRALSAVLGALTVPAVYALGRALFDRVTGVLAALIFLTFPPHLQFSRLALNNVADPLFGTLALAALASALRSGRRRDWLWGGVALGLTQYFYEGGRLLFPVLVAVWLGMGLVVWRPRPRWRDLVLLAAVAVVVGGPVYAVLRGVGFPLTNRLDNASAHLYYWHTDWQDAAGWQTRWEQLKRALLLYIHQPEYSYLYYGRDQPLIAPYLVPLALFGLAVALWQWRRAGLLLALWVAAVALGNALLLESAVTARHVLVLPALALLIALGLRALTLLVGPRPPRGTTVRAAVGIAVALGIMTWQFFFFYVPHLRAFNAALRERMVYDTYDALFRAAELPPGTYVYIVGAHSPLYDRDSQAVLDFLARDLHVEIWPDAYIGEKQLAALPQDADLAFFLPYDRIMLVRLSQKFGAQPLRYSMNPDVPREKALVLFYVPRR